MKMNPFVFFSLLVVFLSGFFSTTAKNTTTPVNVGLVLDLDTEFGKMALSCVDIALSDFYSSHGGFQTRLKVHPRDSMGDVVGAAAAALDLIQNVNVEAIIGPTNSMQAPFLIELGEKAKVPIISFSATSPSLTSLSSSYFFLIAQNDSYQVQPITAILKAFGWQELVPIYVDNEFGQGIIPYLADALYHMDARMPYRSPIPSSASDDQIVSELYKLMNMQTRVFVLHLLPSLASRILEKAKEIGMTSEEYVWIMTDSTGNLLSQIDKAVFNSIQGVLGVKTYVPPSKEVDNFTERWKWKFQQDNPSSLDVQLNVFGLWSYDAVWALAMAIEKAFSISNRGYRKTNSTTNLTELDTFGFSVNGPKIQEALSNTTFSGLSGAFSLIDGQLQSTTSEIVNMNGQGWSTIGFWTPETGVTKTLSSSSSAEPTLGRITWPGDSYSAPKGWEIPTNGKKLRVGVPTKNGFSEFVKVSYDSISNTSIVTGYCIHIFNAVLEELPYAIVPEYIPYNKTNFTYDEMVYEVFLGNFDAVVGDVTIRANRSLFVDFTLPYTESGILMVVPIKDNSKKKVWVFFKPLSWDVWATSGCFFVFIGFVVWVLEHRINEDFRGPPAHQIGTSLWFSFSTMVFAQRETVVSNLARFVVVIWFFVVLILTQSYTASLTSLLTVQQLQPTVTDVNQLLKRKERVGYQDGSFVLGILKSLKFDPDKLVSYSSQEELDELLSKGSAKGGISAAFEEIPYVKLFLSNYCSKYTTTDPSYKTGGFGFVFPSGSPLVADVSRKILNVTESHKMNQIEEKWLGQKNSCSSSNTDITSTSLGIDSFRGLFLIVGTATMLAIISFAITFLYKHRHVLLRRDSNTSLWERIRTILRIYNQRDVTSHTFRKREVTDRSGISAVNGGQGFGSDTPCSNFPQSPPGNLTESGNASPSGGASPNSTPEIELSPQIPETNRSEYGQDITPNRIE